MKLSDFDLRQIDEEKINNLSETLVKNLSITLLNDLKEAREQLNQNSKNSSMPPSSQAPWDKPSVYQDEEDESLSDIESLEKAINTDQRSPKDEGSAEKISVSSTEASSTTVTPILSASNLSRKPGKQLGAKGFGRTQKIMIHHHEHYYPEQCALCQGIAGAQQNPVAHTAFDSLTLEWGNPDQPGIQVINTRHTYYTLVCPCGHITQALPHRQPPDGLLPGVELSQWRLVGPSLAALIVCLSFRMRLSRPRIAKFLHDWLGISLSVGSINKAIHESGRAAMPLEDQLVKEVLASQLLHVDETPWKEKKELLWLWVFASSSVVVFWISNRSAELITNVLGKDFMGWLMSDGFRVYRQFLKRIRCWAHWVRKARGLAESYQKESQAFGIMTLDFLNMLMEAIKQAREKPPDRPLSEIYQAQLLSFRAVCEAMKPSAHKKTRALAVEMLADWDVIFTVLDHPHLPLTNNEAERALRHWVILRRISYGTRTEQGSRIFAMLASVIETCRLRQQCPWRYLESVIENRRAGLIVPPLPVING